MTRQTILHVGPHKTGSTALQLAFHRGEERLAEAGVHYARTGRRGYAHFDLIDWARGRVDLDATALSTEAVGAATLLVSCENVVHLDEAGHERLRDALPAERPVRVVFYLRRLVDLWASHWGELVKHGLPLSIADYVASQAALRTTRNNRIDQVEQVRVLERVFGEGAVEVVGYDLARTAPGGIVADFASGVLDIDPAALDPQGDTVNAAEPSTRTALVRLVNCIHRDVERRAATQELRLAVFRALDAGELPFAERFATVVEARTRKATITVTDLVRMRQERFVELFGDRMRGGREAVDAYLHPRPRDVDWFEFPVTGEEALLAEIVAFYHGLPEAARRSVGQRA